VFYCELFFNGDSLFKSATRTVEDRGVTKTKNYPFG